MTLTILKDGVPQTLAAAKGENLLNVLRTQGYDINSVCSGNGSCGKCKVRFLTTPPPLSRVEQRMLSPQEISEGMRLACRVALEGDCTVEIPSDSDMAIAGAGVEKRENGDGRCFAAVDIGTTTLVAALVDASGSVLATKGEKNRQAAFGADVISRVKHIHTGGLGELQRTVAAQIDSMLLGLLKEFPAARLESTTVSGNTAMLNIFFNEDCSGLGFAPYTPAFLSSRRAPAVSLGLSVGGDVVSVAGMASFAGGDITAGIVALPAQDDGLAMLIDLGTNAEIALYGRGKIWCTSAAAGPAFEGASIRQGMGAVNGAVCSFELVNGNPRVRTIGNKPAMGICGSGLIDIAAQLLENGILDETGRLLGGSFEICDGVSLYAEDIRELQLAKAAIAAAIELLVARSGVAFDDITDVFISGGFGSYINTANAVRLGLLPEQLKKKTAAVGNSSLAGCILCAVSPEKMALADEIAQKAVYLDLTNSAAFSDAYIEHMLF